MWLSTAYTHDVLGNRNTEMEDEILAFQKFTDLEYDLSITCDLMWRNGVQEEGG